MKKIMMAAAAVALSGIVMAGAPREAKADGGAIAIGVTAYLVTDAIIGTECHIRKWPFNLVHKVANELSGRPGCHRVYHRHHCRHHHHHH
jgi:hypothetical protein